MKMTNELKMIKSLCEQFGIPLIDETNKNEAERKKYARAVKYADGNTFQNLGLYFMTQIQFTRWRGEEKKNLIRIFQRMRARLRKRKKR